MTWTDVEKKAQDGVVWWGVVGSLCCSRNERHDHKFRQGHESNITHRCNSYAALYAVCLLTATIAGYYVTTITRHHVIQMLFL